MQYIRCITNVISCTHVNSNKLGDLFGGLLWVLKCIANFVNWSVHDPICSSVGKGSDAERKGMRDPSGTV